MQTIAFDFETWRMGGDVLAPPPVCVSFCGEDNSPELFHAHLDPDVDSYLGQLLTQRVVGHRTAYDLAIIAGYWPHHIPAIFAAFREGRVHDTAIRAQLINLAKQGSIRFVTLPDGSNQPMDYSLAGLEKMLLGIDRSQDKEGTDVWRVNYRDLWEIPLERWPLKALEYARDDAKNTRLVWEKQQEHADLLRAEALHVVKDFGLWLITCYGSLIDADLKNEIAERIAREINEDTLPVMTALGVYRPAEPPRPFANGSKNADGTPKMTAGKKAGIAMKRLREIVQEFCETVGYPVPLTETGNVSISSEVVTDLQELEGVEGSGILKEYAKYQEEQKLVSTELPRMGDGTQRVHFFYRALVDSSRTSSHADKRLDDVFSANGQNIDPRARPCYIADPGHVWVSSDYAGIELVSLGQKLRELFDSSRLADVVDTMDGHAFLGAQIAMRFDDRVREAFQSLTTVEEHYEAFLALKKSPNEEARELFAKYRKFAKPTGLGYPGGLGAATFVKYAKATYGVECTEQEAESLKDVYLATFPEMRDYFRFVTTSLVDPNNPEWFAYRSPLGTLRPRVGYTEACNGFALQTPTAEGAGIALSLLTEACWDPTVGSCLYGCRLMNFIHDEFILQIPEDERMTERIHEIERLMIQGMSHILDRMNVRVESTVMRRWYKQAETLKDEQGNYLVWEPSTLPQT